MINLILLHTETFKLLIFLQLYHDNVYIIVLICKHLKMSGLDLPTNHNHKNYDGFNLTFVIFLYSNQGKTTSANDKNQQNLSKLATAVILCNWQKVTY